MYKIIHELVDLNIHNYLQFFKETRTRNSHAYTGADLGGGCKGCPPPPPPPEMTCGNSNGTGILQKKKKKTMWFIGVEVEQETGAPPPKKNPGSAPAYKFQMPFSSLNALKLSFFRWSSREWNQLPALRGHVVSIAS